ncbi:MAG: plastocyanin/azurin family copper-binding protein [archaeon]
MKRRDFLKGASGVAGGAAATGAASSVGAAQTTTTTSGTETDDGQESGNGTATGTTTAGTTTAGGGGGEGSTEEVAVGPGGSLVFEPEDLEITPGTTVEWVWDSDDHNIVVDEQPDGADWEGTEGGPGTTYDTGHTYSHTFETTGTYEYACEPHRASGMLGTVVVSEDAGAGGGGRGEVDPEEMGVPYQAHYVGIATILAIVVSLLFTFFLLKYGESAHTSSPNRK